MTELLEKMDETIKLLRSIDGKLDNVCGNKFAGTTAGNPHSLMPEPINVCSGASYIDAIKASYKKIIKDFASVTFGIPHLTFKVTWLCENKCEVYRSQSVVGDMLYECVDIDDILEMVISEGIPIIDIK